MSAENPVKVVVADSSVLINLIRANLTRLLGDLSQFEFLIPAEVYAEILPERGREEVDDLIASGTLRLHQITELDALTIFAELHQIMETGEAACLTMAATSPGMIVACDEKRRFIREARERLGEGRLLNTPGLMVLAIRAQRLTIEEADSAKVNLESKRFKMNFASFQEFFRD